MHRRTHLHRIAIGSATAAVALGALAAAPVGATTEPGTTVETTAPDGTAPDDSASDGSAPAGTAPDRGDFERQIDMMLGLVPQAEVEAYYSQQQVDFERRIADCMVEAGFEYQPQSGGQVMMDTNDVEWAQQYGFGIFTTMDPENDPWGSADWVDPNQDYLDSLSEAEQTAFWAQQSRCYENTPYSEDGSEAMWSNSDFQRVMQDFWTDIENDPKLVAATKDWVTCMDDAGHPYPAPDAVWEDWYSQDRQDGTQTFWESQAWLPTSPDHEAWQALVDEEISVAVAAATCGAALEEVRGEITQSKREELVELWQTIDWSAPPVTYPDYVDEWNFDGTIAVDGAEGVPESTPDDGPASTTPGIDLSGVNTGG